MANSLDAMPIGMLLKRVIPLTRISKVPRGTRDAASRPEALRVSMDAPMCIDFKSFADTQGVSPPQ